ncbi:MAG: HIT family protein [Candidatus Nanoarchaeia archaeon]
MAQLTEEDLKNMSPEELRELQKQNCIFCHIASGRVQSKNIYEDDKVLAILDINPANPGHVLLLPKEHHALMPMVPEDEQKYMFMIAKQLSHVLLNALKAEGTNIFLANGAVAGQKAPHVIIHIIPRKEGDGLSFDLPKHPISPQDLKKIQLIIRKSMYSLMKVDDPDLEKELEELKNPKPERPKEVLKQEEPKGSEEKKAAKPAQQSPKEESKEKDDVDLDKISSLFR